LTDTILEYGNYLVKLLGADGLPMFIEMTAAQFEQIYGTAP
jgi:hypothetical protein